MAATRMVWSSICYSDVRLFVVGDFNSGTNSVLLIVQLSCFRFVHVKSYPFLSCTPNGVEGSDEFPPQSSHPCQSLDGATHVSRFHHLY